MQQKHLILAACAALLSLGVYVFTSSDSPQTTATHNTDTHSVKNTQAVVDTTPMASPTNTKKSAATVHSATSKHLNNVEERIASMHERRPDQTFDPTAVAEAIARDAAWQPTKNIPKQLPLRPDEFTDGRQFIQFDSLKLETLMPGDGIKLNIDEVGKNYDIAIDSVEKNDYNSVTWFGHINGDDGQTYSVSFTRGKELTVSGIDTPEGHYVLQAHGNDGWIASSKLLFKVDSHTTDAVYPPSEAATK